MRRASSLYLVLFLVVVAPIGAAVLVSAMLLFGARPATVFAIGFGIKRLFAAGGLHVPNAVGVLGTVGFWWLVIVAIGLLWDRRKRRVTASAEP